MYHILELVQQKKTKFTMEQPYMLPVLYCQYHACWSRQGISRHGIDQISRNNPSLASEELTHCDWVALYGIWNMVVIGLGNGLSPCILIFIQENAFANAVCKMAAILFRPSYVAVFFRRSVWQRWSCFLPFWSDLVYCDVCRMWVMGTVVI